MKHETNKCKRRTSKVAFKKNNFNIALWETTNFVSAAIEKDGCDALTAFPIAEVEAILGILGLGDLCPGY